MAKRHTTEEIVRKLRAAEVALGEGKTMVQVCKQLKVSEQTYYRWLKEYGSMKLGDAKRLKELEQENAKLRIGNSTAYSDVPFSISPPVSLSPARIL